VTANTPQSNPNNLIEVNIQTNSNVVLGDGFSKSFTYTEATDAPSAPSIEGS